MFCSTFVPQRLKLSRVLVVLQLAWVCTSPQLRRITLSDLGPLEGVRGTCGIVPNDPAGLTVSFNICQGLKFWHIASTPTLTM